MSANSKGAALAGLATELHGLVSDITRESRQELQQVRDLLAQSIATLDNSFSAIARDTEQQHRLACDLVNRLDGDNAALADTAGQLELNNDAIQDHLAAAIRSLQFEDLVRQVMEHLDGRLVALGETTAQLAVQAEGLRATAAPDERARQLSALRQQLGSARERLRATDHRAVTQSSMQEGDIDLF